MVDVVVESGGWDLQAVLRGLPRARDVSIRVLTAGE